MNPEMVKAARDSRALTDIVGSDVRLRRIGPNHFVGLCPFHKEKTPSFHVFNHTGTFKCFGCGAWGDSIDYLMRRNGWSFSQAVRQLGGESVQVSPKSRIVQKTVADDEDEKRRTKQAHELWLKRQPIDFETRDPVAKYLLSRGLLEAPQHLGILHEAYCSMTRQPECALISPLQNSSGHVTAVQLVFIDWRSGQPIKDSEGKKLKRTYGCMKDGAVRLSLPYETLGITGSVEDGLSIQQRYSIPVWATCGEQRMSQIWTPRDVHKIIIFADRDETGLKEAEKARRAFQGPYNVEVVFPAVGKDFNDELQGTV